MESNIHRCFPSLSSLSCPLSTNSRSLASPLCSCQRLSRSACYFHLTRRPRSPLLRYPLPLHLCSPGSFPQMDVLLRSLSCVCLFCPFPFTPFRFDFGKPGHLRRLAFSSGSLCISLLCYARRQYLNQFDRKLWCTTGVASSA